MKKLIALLFVLCLFSCNSDKCAGKNFCEMSEECRMQICPALREVVTFDKNAPHSKVVKYRCDVDNNSGFMETYKLTDSLQLQLDESIASESQDVFINKDCDTKYGSVYSYRVKRK